MNRADERREEQVKFENGKDNIIVGTLTGFPLNLDELVSTSDKSSYVDSTFNGGFTATVYKLNLNGNFYTLKKNRDNSMVDNIDGKTSFLNEVQRRRDFQLLKSSNQERYKNIVDTIYADYRSGIILSHWIDGDEITYYDEDIIESIFFTLYNMEKGCVFECDLCSGNFLVQDNKEVRLFDFGYAYGYDPLNEYNSDGKEKPIFHMAERFETRTFMQHLMDIEIEISLHKALEIYLMEKKIALGYYEKKYQWLVENNADSDVINWVGGHISLWKKSFQSQDSLKNLYRLESFRSYLLDVHDDMGGKCCNEDTLLKIDKVLEIVQKDYEFLKDNNGFFWGDEKLSKVELIDAYGEYRDRVIKFQLSDSKAFRQWKEGRIRNIIKYYKGL